VETRTSGAEGGPGKRTRRDPDTAPRPDPYIIGTGRSAIGTLVERSSRSTLLVHLPRMEGWGEKPYVKNGPSLGGYGAVAMNAALTASMTNLPEQLRKTVTWDRGKELSGHAQFALETGTRVFFADPHSPWQRPTNENTVSVGAARETDRAG
jgi:IS30 family transposase